MRNLTMISLFFLLGPWFWAQEVPNDLLSADFHKGRRQEVRKAMHPNMSEMEIQGVHEFVYKKYGAEYEGYPSIVGSGNNGCILHYIENNKPTVGNDMVLMDLGAE